MLVLLERNEMRRQSTDELAAIPGVRRVSWWSNVCPDRTDWLGKLRTLKEFETLGICELEHAIDPGRISTNQRTRPCVAQRFGGGPGHESFDQWELHPDIAIDYVNSFRVIDDDDRVI